MTKFLAWLKGAFTWGKTTWEKVPEEDRKKAIEAGTKAAKKLMEKKK